MKKLETKAECAPVNTKPFSKSCVFQKNKQSSCQCCDEYPMCNNEVHGGGGDGGGGDGGVGGASAGGGFKPRYRGSG